MNGYTRASDEAWQTYHVTTNPDGSAHVFVETNDDNDDGYPDGNVESWTIDFPTTEAAMRYTGKSRVGISGVKVNVWLDGKELT